MGNLVLCQVFSGLCQGIVKVIPQIPKRDLDACVLIRRVVICQGVKLYTDNFIGRKLRFRNQCRFVSSFLLFNFSWIVS
jgi:hypothetical protein